MKESVVTYKKCPKKLFHLSIENHDGEWFKPRVPYSIVYSGEHKEDDKVKRVCFSSSISGAFFGINFDGYYQKLYVHVPENIENIVKRRKLCKPTDEQVFDVDYTDEYWIKCKVKLKCVGCISIGYRPNWHSYKPKVKFKYLKRFQNGKYNKKSVE